MCLCGYHPIVLIHWLQLLSELLPTLQLVVLAPMLWPLNHLHTGLLSVVHVKC